jgi:hypothetical protein
VQLECLLALLEECASMNDQQRTAYVLPVLPEAGNDWVRNWAAASAMLSNGALKHVCID